MHFMEEYLKTVPFDLYELHLFRLVVEHCSFTKAAEIAGLTQSAITRQIQGMENKLGIDLLERTTRSVRPTAAGAFLNSEAIRLSGNVDQTLQKLREEFAGAKKAIRVGVSRTIGLAYLPGFFHAGLKQIPQISCRVSHQPSKDMLLALEANELDVGVLCPPQRLPRTLRVTHQFEDAFTLIAPVLEAGSFTAAVGLNQKKRREWMAKQRWLLISEASQTGQRLQSWFGNKGWRLEPAMQLDNFDLIINLVALGLGASFVPIRALALYHQKKGLQRVMQPERFVRDLVVVVRKNRKMPQHLQQFIESILF